MFKKAFWVPYEDSANYPTLAKTMEAISKYCEENGKSYTFINDDEVEINGKRYEIYRGYENGSRGNYGIKCKVPKTERTAATKVDGGKGEQISKLRLFVDNMLTDKCSQFSNNEGYNNMINSIGGYEFERIFQPINFILDSMISIKMDEDKNLKNRIKNIRHYDNVKDKYKYIVNVTNYSTYPVFLGTYLKRMYLETEINVDK